MLSFGRSHQRDSIYTSVLPLILLLAAGLVYTRGGELAFGIAAAAQALVGVYAFVGLLFGRTKLTVFKLFGLTYCLGFGLSSFNTWATNHEAPDSLSIFVHYDYQTLCHGLAFVCLSAALFFFLGEVIEGAITLDATRFVGTDDLVWFIWGAFAVVLTAFIKGSLGYMGFSNAGGKIDVLGSLAYWLISPLFALTMCQAIHAKASGRRIVYWVLLAVVAIMVFPLGRRVLIYTFLLAGLILRADPKVTAISLKAKLIASLTALILLGAGTFAFLYLRFATYSLGDGSYSLLRLASEAVGVFETVPYSQIVTAMQDNAEARGFILGYSAAVLEFSQDQQLSTASGEGILDAITLAVPSVLNPDKLEHLPEQEEIVVNRLFGTDYIDEANTLLSAGAVDFGFFGALLYPVVAAVTISLLLRKASTVLSPVVGTVVTLAVLYAILNVETTPTSYLVIVRDSSLFSVALTFLLRFRPRLSDWASGPSFSR